jgi:hypothetical protein
MVVLVENIKMNGKNFNPFNLIQNAVLSCHGVFIISKILFHHHKRCKDRREDILKLES